MTQASDVPYLDPEPPPWAARGLAWLLIAVFVLSALAAAIVRVPETVSAPFVLVPEKGTDPIRAPHRGIVKAVRIAEGQPVEKGQPTFVIQSEAAADRSAELGSIEAHLRGAGEALGNVRARYESQLRADERERARVQERLAYLERAIALKRSQHDLAQGVADSYRELQQQGLASTVEYSQRQLEAHRLAQELGEAEAERVSSRAALLKLGDEIEARGAEQRELERRLAEEQERQAIRVAPLRQDLAQTVGGEISLPAPCSGTVLNLRVRSAGAFVEDGAVLCELACAQERLQAELAIPPSAAGRVGVDQGVKLLYAAFPYQRYGVRRGTIRWIVPAALRSGEGDVPFRARADLQDTVVWVDGRPRPLQAGMRGVARVVIGRKTLLSHAFGPLRRLREDLAP